MGVWMGSINHGWCCWVNRCGLPLTGFWGLLACQWQSAVWCSRWVRWVVQARKCEHTPSLWNVCALLLWLFCSRTAFVYMVSQAAHTQPRNIKLCGGQWFGYCFSGRGTTVAFPGRWASLRHQIPMHSLTSGSVAGLWGLGWPNLFSIWSKSKNLLQKNWMARSLRAPFVWVTLRSNQLSTHSCAPPFEERLATTVALCCLGSRWFLAAKWDVLQAGEAVRKMRCGHMFHVDCIDVWLRQCSSCPLCNQVLTILYAKLPVYWYRHASCLYEHVGLYRMRYRENHIMNSIQVSHLLNFSAHVKVYESCQSKPDDDKWKGDLPFWL